LHDRLTAERADAGGSWSPYGPLPQCPLHEPRPSRTICSGCYSVKGPPYAAGGVSRTRHAGYAGPGRSAAAHRNPGQGADERSGHGRARLVAYLPAAGVIFEPGVSRQ
jgi:hypothetical protein